MTKKSELIGDRSQESGTDYKRAQSAWSLLPSTLHGRAVLEQRAASLAVLREKTEADEGAEQYLLFHLGKREQYGIAYGSLDELLYVGQISSVPCTPRHVVGVMNHRGELLTILDLQAFFDVEPAPHGADSRIIVVRSGSVRVGLLVHEIEGYEVYIPSRLTPPIESAGVTNLDYVTGIYEGTIAMLNIDSMLADPQLIIDDRRE